jgi:hypothetical protein
MSNYKYVEIDENEHGIIVMADDISEDEQQELDLDYPSRGETAVTIKRAREIAAALLSAADELADRQPVKPRFYYMPEDATEEDWRAEVMKQLAHVTSNVREGVDVRYATELLRESVDRYLVAAGAETGAAE